MSLSFFTWRKINLPETRDDMYEDQEHHHEEDQTLHTFLNSKYFLEILDELVADLGDLDQPHHLYHANDLVYLANAGEPRKSINICHVYHCLERNDRHQVKQEPA
jgi:hypothetical protein